MVSVDSTRLHSLAVAIYEAAGTPTAHARIVASHQVGANLVGHDSHGVHLLPTYIQRIDRGHIIPASRPVVIKESAASIFVNGQWGFGPVITEWAMERVIAKAKEVGVAVGSVIEQSHVGRLADYPLMATRAGFIGMMMCDSGQSTKSVAPFGGREAKLGTNPLCIAFPSDLPGPIFADMATSAVAGGKLAVARARRTPIPLGWILDKDGKATTDANDFYNGGIMMPLGGQEAHKGYALSFAVETMASILPGLGFGINPQHRHNDGCFLLAVNPEVFRPAGDFKTDVEDFVRYLKATLPAEGFSEVLYPGEMEYRTGLRREKDGIPIEEDTWKKVTEVAERFGVAETAKAAIRQG